MTLIFRDLWCRRLWPIACSRLRGHMTDDPLIAAFFEEAAELLSDFEAGLLQLEARPDDVELLNGIFRGAHTLKGNSAMLGFEAIARVTHGLEDVLDQLRKGQR